MTGPVFNDTGDFAPTEVQVVHFRLKGEYMKKLLTLLCALALSASLAFAQGTAGSSGSASTDTTPAPKTTKKHHAHKGGKKHKKADSSTTTPPPK
jgi:hypothetical protein